MPEVSCCAAGLSSVQDDLFRSSFVDVYSSPSLKGVPWHAVLGYAATRSPDVTTSSCFVHLARLQSHSMAVRLTKLNVSTATMTMARAGCQRQRSARQPIPTASTAHSTRSDVLQARAATSGGFDFIDMGTAGSAPSWAMAGCWFESD